MARTPRDAWPVAASVHLYRLLLAVYPARFRCRFGAEMARTFRDACREAYRRRGAPAVPRLWPGTLGDLVRSAAAERFDKLRRPGRRRQWRRLQSHAVLYGAYTTAAAPFPRMEASMRASMHSRHALKRALARLFHRHGGAGGRPPVAARSHFDQFTGRARHVLLLGQEEAHRLRHSSIDTEHLLLGLLREEGGVAAAVLAGLGVELADVRAEVERITGRGGQSVPGPVRLTPRAKRAIELAVDEARLLDHHSIGTEHLLLGLIREKSGIAAGLLHNQGATLQRAREEVARALRERSDGPDEP